MTLKANATPSADACSKLVEVVTAADVDDEDRVGNNFFLQIRKLRFGHKSKLCSDFEHKVWILRLKFRQDLKLELPERKKDPVR